MHGAAGATKGILMGAAESTTSVLQAGWADHPGIVSAVAGVDHHAADL